MMFSIDLLKGKGLPEKTDLKRLLLRIVPLLIPVITVMVFASGYNRTCIECDQLQAKLESNQRLIVKHKDDVTAYDHIDGQIKDMKKCLKDISKALNYRIQISDVLVELVNLLPEDVFVHEMKLDRNVTQERYTEENTGNTKHRLYVRRKMKLILCGFGVTGADEAVQTYVNALRQSDVLAKIITDVKPTARQLGEVDERSAVYYEIECILKQQG